MSNEKKFSSSDSVRSAKELKYLLTETFDEPVRLELGGELPNVTIAYETYGQLNEARDNAVLLCHAITGDSHIASHDSADDPGWWELVVGPGKAIDTEKYFVVCPNILGGCRGTTGPNSVNPETSQPYGADFPTITILDIISVQKNLLERIGVNSLLAVVGGSFGGHQALCWASTYPKFVNSVIAMATSSRLNSQSLAFDIVARNAITSDPNFNGGQYYGCQDHPDKGLAIARMLGHITYLSREAMQEKFDPDRNNPRDFPTEFEKQFSVGSYLAHQGEKFVERFDANSYIVLSRALDMFDMGVTPQEISKSLSKSQCRWLVMSFSSDWLFPPAQVRELVEALILAEKSVSYCNVSSNCGHDAFLLPNDLDTYGQLIGAFLANLSSPAVASADDTQDHHAPTSIFHEHRVDYDKMVSLISPGTSVLDLGCGRGGLLARLKERSNNSLLGVELDEQAIIDCVRRSLDVVQCDLNEGLSQFAAGQFDYVVLSQTLQTVRDVENIVGEMIRIGRRGIVSFPNFGYSKLVEMLQVDGRAPMGDMLNYQWYDTPNIRFLTLVDFENFCEEKNIKIHRKIALDTETGNEISGDPNRNADTAIYVISA